MDKLLLRKSTVANLGVDEQLLNSLVSVSLSEKRAKKELLTRERCLGNYKLMTINLQISVEIISSQCV